jgi:hypothetical protein
MPKDDFEYRADIIIKEWDMTQTNIARFDTLMFALRGIAATSVGAIFSVAATLEKPLIILGGTIPIFIFWMLDAIYKTLQRNVIIRSREIESYLSGSFPSDIAQRQVSFVSPKLADQFRVTYRRASIRAVFRSAVRINVAMPYVTLIVSCFILCALAGALFQGSGAVPKASVP